MLAHLYAVSGKRSEAIKILEGLKTRYKVSPYDLAIIYTGLAEKQRALESLEKAYEERTGGLLLLKVEPIFDSLRPDPRFVNLLRRLGLAPSVSRRSGWVADTSRSLRCVRLSQVEINKSNIWPNRSTDCVKTAQFMCGSKKRLADLACVAFSQGRE